jgi:cyclopropane fatty-acyl-phospholipid synthase-like methyltransferase
MSNPYCQLDFPLNIYAHCLYLEQGKVDYLHYALFTQEESFQQIQIAQQRSTELLLARLPRPPARILEIGVGLGTTAKQLVERGYEVTGISLDCQQIALAQQRCQESHRLSLKCIAWEEFSAPVASYDIILLQESAQYLDTLLLFNKAYELLTPDGFVLVADEVNLKKTPKYATYGLPSLTYTLAQAQRCGFELIENLDLSLSAAPTIDYLLWVIKKHYTTLQIDLNLTFSVLDDLLKSLDEYQQKYYDGHYNYVLLKFKKSKPPRWKITAVTSTDKLAIRQLFNEVFAPEQMTDHHWEWKYGQGRGLGIVAWRNGHLVAHYGGVLRDISYFGQPKPAVQITDVMVSALERGVFTRRGVFFLTTATFLECYMGYGALTWLGFGFPDQRAMKIAQHLDLYAPVGEMIELRWQTTLGKPHFWTRIRHLHPQFHHKNKIIIDKLWQQMQTSLSHALVGVRDWHYIHHRYLSHPNKQYEILLISNRFTGQALGIAIIERQEGTCHLRDFIGNIKHIPMVIKQIRRMAGHWGMHQVSLWITENFASVFPLSQAEQHPLPIQIPHNIWSQGVSSEEIQGHWWLMSGDTDFL